MDSNFMKVGHKFERTNRNDGGEDKNAVIGFLCCEIDENGAVHVKTTAEIHHSVTNTSGNP